jgi:hypothetical protein
VDVRGVHPDPSALGELALRVAQLAGADAAAVRRGLDGDPAGFALNARQAALPRPAEPTGNSGGLAPERDQLSRPGGAADS